MNKEEFIELIKDYQKNREHIDTISNIFPNFWELNCVDYGNTMFEKLLNVYFKEESVDWIYWWLFEKDGNPEYKAWDKDNNEIPTETIEDLWDIVKDGLKS